MIFRACHLLIDGQKFELRPNRPNSFEPFFADFQFEKGQPDGSVRWRLMLHPKRDFWLQHADIQWDKSAEKDECMLANGFQSASETRLLPLESSVAGPSFLDRKSQTLGDGFSKIIERGAGWLHAWSFTFFRKKGGAGAVDFVGSLDERSGLTLFQHDLASGIFFAKREIGDGLRVRHSTPVFDLFLIEKSDERAAFRAFFAAQNLAEKGSKRQLAFSVSSQIELEELPLLASPPTTEFPRFQAEKGVFSGENAAERVVGEDANNGGGASLSSQIDAPSNGGGQPANPKILIEIGKKWSAEIGDWLEPIDQKKWPGGLASAAQKISEKGATAGLWLAPFWASKNSKITRERPGWLLLEPHSKRPVQLENGHFALDFSKNEVRDWLAGLFHVAVEKWKIDAFRLDGLACAGLFPPNGQTRGQAFFEALEFFKNCAAGRPIVAAGGPIGTVFGLANGAEIGCGIDSKSSFSSLGKRLFRRREQAENRAALRSILSRAAMSAPGFWTVSSMAFSSEKSGKKINEKRQAQQLNALIINLLCVDQPFFEGPFDELFWKIAHHFFEAQLESVRELEDDFFEIRFSNFGRRGLAFSNLSSSKKIGIFPPNRSVEILPFRLRFFDLDGFNLF